MDVNARLPLVYLCLFMKPTVGTRTGGEEPSPCICSHMLQKSDVSGFMAALMC